MTFITEVGAGVLQAGIKVVVPAATQTVAATVPSIASETVAAGAKALVEPVKAAAPALEAATKPVFEATKPLLKTPEAAKSLLPDVALRDVFDTFSPHTGVEMVAEGFLTGSLDTPGMDLLPSVLQENPGFQALAYYANHMGIPPDMTADPVFLSTVANRLDSLKSELAESPEGARFGTFAQKLREILQQTRDAYEAGKLEKLKKKAELEAIKQRMDMYRDSILRDDRLSEEGRQIALERVARLESALQTDADLRLTFGRNILTFLIGHSLISEAEK